MFNNEGYKIRGQSKPHYLTFTVVDWVDVFTRRRYKDIIVDSLRYCQQDWFSLCVGPTVAGTKLQTSHSGLLLNNQLRVPESLRTINSINQINTSMVLDIGEFYTDRSSRNLGTYVVPIYSAGTIENNN